MDLTLTRTDYAADGIFSELVCNKTGKMIAYIAEHAYHQTDGTFAPKLPPGVYTCQRGQHQLHSIKVPFETFEITKVPNHFNILFHAGNWPQVDSDGCSLLGEAIAHSPNGRIVTNSRMTFGEFMTLQTGVDQFQLTVVA